MAVSHALGMPVGLDFLQTLFLDRSASNCMVADSLMWIICATSIIDRIQAQYTTNSNVALDVMMESVGFTSVQLKTGLQCKFTLHHASQTLVFHKTLALRVPFKQSNFIHDTNTTPSSWVDLEAEQKSQYQSTPNSVDLTSPSFTLLNIHQLDVHSSHAPEPCLHCDDNLPVDAADSKQCTNCLYTFHQQCSEAHYKECTAYSDSDSDSEQCKFTITSYQIK